MSDGDCSGIAKESRGRADGTGRHYWLVICPPGKVSGGRTVMANVRVE
jgi:hypothetical protein